MRSLAVLVMLIVALNLGLLGIIYSRKTMELQLAKAAYFETVKHRLANDVLGEFESNISEGTKRLDDIKTEVVDLTSSVKVIKDTAVEKEKELQMCNDEMTELTNDISVLQKEKNNTDSDFQKKNAILLEEINNLNTELGKRSKFCDYVVTSSDDVKKLCSVVLEEKRSNKNKIA